jgi:hypothetical protein
MKKGVSLHEDWNHFHRNGNKINRKWHFRFQILAFGYTGSLPTKSETNKIQYFSPHFLKACFSRFYFKTNYFLKLLLSFSLRIHISANHFLISGKVFAFSQ